MRSLLLGPRRRRATSHASPFTTATVSWAQSFFTRILGQGLYAIADVPDNCFEFQVGADQPLQDRP